MKLLLLSGWRTRFAALALLLWTWPSAGQLLPPNSNVSISIPLPTNGSVFFAPANVLIDAWVYDPDDEVSAVGFAARPTGIGAVPQFVLYLGTVTNYVILFPPSTATKLFIFDWSNALGGTWDVIAGTEGTLAEPASASVEFTVLPTTTSNSFLSVDIAAPANGAFFPTPTNIQLIAGVVASNDSPAFVEFFDGNLSLGIVTNWAVVDPPGSPGLPPGSRAYFLNWSNQSFGAHVLTADVLDTNGLTFYSAPVSIMVGSNVPPVVRITSPPDNSIFYAPVNIALLAYANDPGGYIASVQFFAGSNSLGFGQPVRVPIAQPLTPTFPPIHAPTNIFALIWSNAPVGSNLITALATDDSGDATTSAPVNITVLPAPPPPPPPPNRPDFVSIVATDPIAIAGTNCWPWLGLSNTPPTWRNWTSPTALWCWFTNCGPKDATFTVHRQGQDTNDLTVAYSIGGTATNGVDYMTLPGVVTIPAGQSEAMITVVPISDGVTNGVGTVVLGLTPSTNTPPDYLVGFPRAAEVIIIDNNWPRLVPPAAFLPDRSFHLCLPGPDGAWFRIDYSTNLLYWTSLCTNQVIDGSIDFIDPDAAGSPTRLYRTVPLAGPPAN